MKIPRINPPLRGDYDISADSQQAEGHTYHLHGNVVIELYDSTFKADDADYDETTKTFTAHGHVYYRNYDQNEVIYCDSAEYNTDTAKGIFYHVRGYTKTKVVARPGVLTTQAPFYFEGQWAEKLEDKYILHDGMITDCNIPNPWWTLNGNIFDIIPGDRAVTRDAVFHLRGIPIFYFPYFYKALQKEPRKSGFLTPEAGHSSQFGYFFGLGYYWAINRSYDMTYLATDYTSRGIAQHLDFRGKPNQNTDFNVIAYGVDDHGGSSAAAPGASVTGVIKSDLGDGWVVRGYLDYLSSYLFRQTFSTSFSEAVYSTTNSVAFLSKDFDYYTFHTDVSRNQDFESTTPGDDVVIRKLPEFNFTGRDQQILDGPVPLWFSFDSTYGLYHRVDPAEANSPFYETSQFTQRGDMEPSLTSAFHWDGFDVVPSFTMHETFYGQSIDNNTATVLNQPLNRAAPEMKVDIVFPTIEKVYNKKTIFGDKLKHVIEPRVTYDYVTGVNDFVNTLRFDQLDLLADTNQVKVGMTNRLYAKKGDTVSEVFTWEIFEERYFNPTFGGAVVAGQRNVSLVSLDLTGFSFLDGPRTYSPVVNIMRFVPKAGFSVQWEGDYDPLFHRFTNSILAAGYTYKKFFIGGGSNLVKPDPVVSGPTDQISFQARYGDPNRKGWNAAVSTVYDVRLGIQEFAVAQVTYNTDCCGFSVEWRRFDFGVVNDTSYRFAFSIANIGTFGNLKKQERLF